MYEVEVDLMYEVEVVTGRPPRHVKCGGQARSKRSTRPIPFWSWMEDLCDFFNLLYDVHLVDFVDWSISTIHELCTIDNSKVIDINIDIVK